MRLSSWPFTSRTTAQPLCCHNSEKVTQTLIYPYLGTHIPTYVLLFCQGLRPVQTSRGSLHLTQFPISLQKWNLCIKSCSRFVCSVNLWNSFIMFLSFYIAVFYIDMYQVLQLIYMTLNVILKMAFTFWHFKFHFIISKVLNCAS